MARTGRKNKTKFVITKELVILVVVLVGMIVATICLSIPSKAEKQLDTFNNAITEYNTANSTSYTLLGEDHVYVQADLEKVSEAIENSSSDAVYIFYGGLANATVLEFLSKIDAEAKNREVEQVYFYNSEKVDNQSDKEDEEFLASIENDEKHFKANDQYKVDLLVTPALYVYKNKELVFSSIESVEEGYNWNIIINQAFSK